MEDTLQYELEPLGRVNEKDDGPTSSEAFETILEHVKPSGRWQIRLFFIVSFSGVFVAMQNFASAFLAASPDYWCDDTELQDLFLPARDSLADLPHVNELYDKYLRCNYYDIDYSELLSKWQPNDTMKDVFEQIQPKYKCSSWHYDNTTYASTIITEWDLVCDKNWMKSAALSIYMAGVLFGGLFLSELSDVYGRCTVVRISTVLFIISNISSAFAPNYIAYVTIRFLTAFFGFGVFLPNFVLLMEVIGSEARTWMGVMYQALFGVGVCLLPAIAYVIRDWRSLQLALSVPSVLLLMYFWVLPESPRWLLLHGREKEAIKILREMARVNKGCLPPDGKLKFLISRIVERKTKSYGILQKFASFFKSQVKLVRTPIIRRRSLIMFSTWFVISMVYYGLAFSGDNINSSIYVLIFVSGAVELPALCLGIITLKKFGRRLNLCLTLFLSGVACLLILAVPKDMVWLNVTLAAIGKFCICVAFSIGYIYSAELVPTEMRNISVGTCSMYARIGSMLAPFIVNQLGAINYVIPSTLFGVLSIIVAGVSLLLPETGGKALPETIDDVESEKK